MQTFQNKLLSFYHEIVIHMNQVIVISITLL